MFFYRSWRGTPLKIDKGERKGKTSGGSCSLPRQGDVNFRVRVGPPDENNYIE